jgi:beta-glucosidase
VPRAATALDFPSGFLWGAATSGHQVEGDNRWSDWWQHEQSGRLPHRSGAACRHYELFEQDFDLARRLGHNAHRLSIEWSRIEPREGERDAAALEHYRSVIQALRSRGLEPVVTLHHFTSPAWFSASGGWLRRDAPRLFARHVEYVGRRLAPEVRYWLTVNEPTVLVMQGYINGVWPPFLRSAWRSATLACRNLARAHVAGYQALHRCRTDCLVSFAHSAPWVEPCDPTSRRDRIGAWIRDLILNRAFLAMIGARPRWRPKAPLDFIGLNYYTRAVIRSSGWGPRGLLGHSCHRPHHADQGPLSTIGWEVYPIGLRAVLRRFASFGLPLLITENGIATDDENLRETFLAMHLEQLATALSEGVDVIGYLYWSLMDNFEWDHGAAPHFGLAAVDETTKERRIRPAAEWLARICRDNRVAAAPIAGAEDGVRRRSALLLAAAGRGRLPTGGRPAPAALQEHPNREEEEAQDRDEDGDDDGDQAAEHAQPGSGPDIGQRRA